MQCKIVHVVSSILNTENYMYQSLNIHMYIHCTLCMYTLVELSKPPLLNKESVKASKSFKI